MHASGEGGIWLKMLSFVNMSTASGGGFWFFTRFRELKVDRKFGIKTDSGFEFKLCNVFSVTVDSVFR